MKPCFETPQISLYQGDCLAVMRSLPAESINCVVTSPPYFGLRDYGHPDQIGLEATVAEYIGKLVEVFEEVRRVLRSDGVCWLNLGDSYASSGGVSQPHRNSSNGFSGSDGQRTQGYALAGGGFKRPDISKTIKPKNLCLIPHRAAIALQDSGWYVRSEIIWHKQAPMPESVQDRCTRSHEHIWMLTKEEKYWYNAEAVKENAVSNHPSGNGFKRSPRLSFLNEDGTPRGNDNQWIPTEKRNLRDVWTLPPSPNTEAHFATFVPEIPRRCILASCPQNGTVLDPFVGSGTTAFVAKELGRKAIGIDLNPDYLALAADRCQQLTIFSPQEATA
jgi:site-specific DNA-methyltransferase (adenine-specific)